MRVRPFRRGRGRQGRSERIQYQSFGVAAGGDGGSSGYLCLYLAPNAMEGVSGSVAQPAIGLAPAA